MTKTKSMIYCGLFTALIAAGAFIKIPVPVVPFTLQYLFTMLAGLFLGSRKGMISVVAYIFAGAGGTSDLFGRRWNLVYFQAKLRLYYRVLPGNIRNRTYRRTS